MAEGVVGSLIVKLGLAMAEEAASLAGIKLCHEASALMGLFGKIREVKQELESMQAFLRGAERLKDIDETMGIYIKNIRGLAFEIEDVVDEFTYKLEDGEHGGGFATKMKKRITNIKTWRRLAAKLQEIMMELKSAESRKGRYDMSGFKKEGGCSSGASQASRFAREEDLVGIEENKELLMHWLQDDMEQKSIITTVWGMGGVGKTTLVSQLYNAVKMKFDASAWVNVSKGYQVEDLLEQIIRGFGKIASMEAGSLFEIIHKYLQGKSYLLVLDDVWDPDVWYKIRNAFPSNCISRFVITSRIHQVASLATKNCVIELKPLKEHHSWELFCKEAFWKNDNRICPAELYHLAQKFVHRCDGLPIAIACIGRLLSYKNPSYSEWQELYKELELQLTNDVSLDFNIILKISLEDLPYNLKNCFLHCTVFPEDFVMNRRRLMRHWVAAGFIKETNHKTMEEVAEGFLNELVNRSLLQVVERNYHGRVRSVRMHDIIRLLALTKSKEEYFCKVYDGLGTFPMEKARHLSIQSTNIEELTRSSGPSPRSLYVFHIDLNIDSLTPLLKSFTLLSTLDLRGVQMRRLPSEVFNLFNLRFLGLRETGIENLPKEIGRLQNLQVLDAWDTELSNLPVEVVTLRKLRHLYAVTIPKEHNIKIVSHGGVWVPKGIRHLTNLQALQFVEANSEILSHLGALTELRTFGVTKVKSEHCADLSYAMKKMTHLSHLGIVTADQKQVLHLEGLCLPPTLSKLDFAGQLDKKLMTHITSSSLHLGNLTKLHLGSSKLDEDSFACLLDFHGLVELYLWRAYEGKELRFPATSFPKLRMLEILEASYLNKVTIEQGAMRNLVQLYISDCPELKVLPDGIEHLTALEGLYLSETSLELRTKLVRKSHEDHTKISHIKRVIVS